MASEYLYGTYGQVTGSVVEATTDVSTIGLYVGTAPVNLVRGYATAGVVNTPVKINNNVDAQQKIGIASDWDKYTLSEAITAHFANANGNVGPIYVINVLDPDTHRKADATSATLNFVNGSASFESEDIILDTIAIADKAEGTDYAINYNFTTHKVTISSVDEENPLSGAIAVTYYEVDTSNITASTIIGARGNDGTYTGMQAAYLIYQTYDAVVNLLAIPKWSSIKSVYSAMVALMTKLNGHWDGFVYADIPIAYDSVTYEYTVVTPGGSENPSEEGWYERSGSAGSYTYALSTDTSVDSEKTYCTRTETTTEVACDTIAKAVAYKAANAMNSERSKVFWPMAEGTDDNIYHLSTLAMVETMKLDGSHNGVPMESCGNKAVAVSKQYFGENSDNLGFDVTDANNLCSDGIDTLVYWGSAWKLWGDHTAAYVFGSSDVDPRAIFDVSMRMLFFLTNRFQRTWASFIDKPFSVQLKDTIITREQERLDALVVMGALIGTPSIVFEESNNSIEDMRNGIFRWDIQVTPTPPLKAASAYVAYTDAGFSAYFE